jgi:hypothetical protein
MRQIIFIIILVFAFSGAASYAQTNKDFCSEIKFDEEQRLLNVDEPAQIKVEVNEEFKKYKIDYLWTISGGKITRGQGTSAIELTPDFADNGYNIYVTVKLNGLPENCLDTNSHTFAVTLRSFDPWFDMFGKLPKDELQGRLDNFFVALGNASDAEGLIVLEFDKNEAKAKKIRRLNEIVKHLNLRKFDKTRLSFLILETDKEYTKLYIVPRGAKFTQVISESDLPNIIKGEELDRKIKELFPKK